MTPSSDKSTPDDRPAIEVPIVHCTTFAAFQEFVNRGTWLPVGVGAESPEGSTDD